MRCTSSLLFLLSGCSAIFPIDRTRLTDAGEVVSVCVPNPCNNDGRCTPGGDTVGFACMCAPGFSGTTCDDIVTCTGLVAPEYGFIDKSTAVYDEDATYGCEGGFYLAGNGGLLTRTCLETGDWSGTPPTCEPTGGYASWPLPGGMTPYSYELSADRSTVRDNVTGLVWRVMLDDGIYPMLDGIAFCDSLTFAGESDWRLPSRMELMTTIDLSRMAPTVDPAGFPGTPITYFWSATMVPGSSTNAFYADLRGGMFDGPISGSQRVRCVRGTPAFPDPLSPRFEINGDGTVTDPVTGLVWHAMVSPTALTFSDAAIYCGSFGGAGWRVPTIMELQSIVDESHSNPTIDESIFGTTPGEVFWSITGYAGDPDNAWAVDFSSGIIFSPTFATPCRVRCVR